MEKNLLIAVALSMGVYLLWFGYVDKKYGHPMPAAPTATAFPRLPGASVPAAPEPAAAAPQARAETIASAYPARLDGSEAAKINPRGAAIASFSYRGPLSLIELIDDPDPGFFATAPELTFRPQKPGLFTATRPDGAVVTKEFVPGQGTVLPRLQVTIENPTRKSIATGAWSLAIGPGLGTVESERAENAKTSRAIGLTHAEGGGNGKVEVFKPGERPLAYRWVAVDNRYFLAAALPSPEDFDQVTSAQPPALTIRAKSVTLAPGTRKEWVIPYYLGAKGNTWLTRYNAGLERSINFGFFAQLGRKILQFLNMIHERTGNWGWSIILLTMCLQILLSPLTYKSLKSAAAMKKLQPEIARLQQKYSKDPTRLNAEMMELYKKTGANPLGGCLPMLIQMPVFVALFNTLRNAWELHGAPWAFWIKDLSARDPFYVLPVVMGGLMFAQNKLNPPTTDPNQAMMMNVMPIMFTVMFLRFPSGLVLYWLTNSVMSALQQLALKRHFERAA